MSSSKKDKLIAFNKNNILEAARKLFAERGMSGTSVDDIAKTANYSKSTIYIYFKNKNDIYYHIVLEYMIILRDKIQKCIEDFESFEKCYYDICYALVDAERQYPMYFDCILGKISVSEDDFILLTVLKDIYDVGEDVNHLIESLLKKAQEQGVMKESINTLPTTFVLWSNICGLISIAANKEEYFNNRLQMSKDDFLQYGFAFIFNSIRKES